MTNYTLEELKALLEGVTDGMVFRSDDGQIFEIHNGLGQCGECYGRDYAYLFTAAPQLCKQLIECMEENKRLTAHFQSDYIFIAEINSDTDD